MFLCGIQVFTAYYPDLDAKNQAEEQSSWELKLHGFFNQDRGKGSKSVSTAAKQRTRYGALDFMNNLENALIVSFGTQLQDFMHEAPSQIPVKQRKEHRPKGSQTPKTKKQKYPVQFVMPAKDSRDHSAREPSKSSEPDALALSTPIEFYVGIDSVHELPGDMRKAAKLDSGNVKVLDANEAKAALEATRCSQLSIFIPELPGTFARAIAERSHANKSGVSAMALQVTSLKVAPAQHFTENATSSRALCHQPASQAATGIRDHGSCSSDTGSTAQDGQTHQTGHPGSASSDQKPVCLKSLAVLCMDEGSPGWSATYFLMLGLRMHIIGLRDPIHRAVNDWKQGVKEAKFWPTVSAAVLPFNICYGPWGGERWWAIAQGGAQGFVRNSQAGDPLFRWLEQKVAASTGDPMFELNPDIVTQSLETKGPKTALFRWFSWVAAARVHMPHWWPRATALLVAGLELGYFKTSFDFVAFRSGGAESLANPGAGEAEQDDGDPNLAGAKAGTAHEEASVRRAQATLRAKSKNNLHACCRVMADETLYQNCMFVLQASIPFHNEHGNTVKVMQAGHSEILRLNAQWSLGFWLKPVRLAAGLLLDLQKLAGCSLTTARVTRQHIAGSEECKWLALFENAQCERLSTLVLSLMQNRIRSMLWHSSGVPGLFACIWHDEEAGQQEGLRRLSKLVRQVQEASQSRISFITKMAHKSMVHAPAIAELISALGTFSKVPVEVKERVGFIFGGLGSTDIIENVFRVCRNTEERKQLPKSVRRERRMRAAIDSDLLAQRCRSNIHIDKGHSGKLNKGMFQARACRNELLLAIKDKRTWASFTPQSSSELHGDTMLFDVLSQAHVREDVPYNWSHGPRCWQSTFLRSGQIYTPSCEHAWCCISSPCGLWQDRPVAFIILGQLGPVSLAWPVQLVASSRAGLCARYQCSSNSQLLSYLSRMYFVYIK